MGRRCSYSQDKPKTEPPAVLSRPPAVRLGSLSWKDDDVKSLLLLLLLVCLASAACGNASPGIWHTVTGQVIDSGSPGTFNRQAGKSCVGGLEGPIYPAGTEVEVLSRRNGVRYVAIGRLSAGTTRDNGTVCQWNFTVRHVHGASSYVVEVVNGPGEVVEDPVMRQMGWKVTL